MFHTKAYLRNQYESWGRTSRYSHWIQPVFERQEPITFNQLPHSVLPFGLGRSYGDVCLNEGGILLDTSYLNHFINFDKERGILRCEAGVSLSEILGLTVPQRWFLSVSPGTQYVTLGGAIANDVHGKNHHVGGTFGRHVLRFELLRSSGERILCSKDENAEMFRATIGGLGLTGLILWAEIQLKRIESPFVKIETEKFRDLEEFFEITEESDKKFELTAAWMDGLTGQKSFCRGLAMRGNYAGGIGSKQKSSSKKIALTVPFEMPSFFLNRMSLKMFNTMVYAKQRKKVSRKISHFGPFFYPLDVVHRWNMVYGKKGFFQYQCVVPDDSRHQPSREILKKIAERRLDSYLVVLKKCGDIESPGLLSFTQAGVAFAMDFPNRGEKTLKVLDELDEIVKECGGKVNPSKDARMSAKMFQCFYPRWQEFEKYRDPKFSSSFWRRVTKGVL